ncbi:MAG: methyltransferase domain-containing protein [Bdellovibrionaceae bacterium]|nr:methyltransferase domain-containing protein [Pseudobdellovibrionaceae bacterium]
MKLLNLRGVILFVFTVQVLAMSQPIWANGSTDRVHSAKEIFRQLKCQRFLSDARKNVLDPNKLEKVEIVDLRGEDGTFVYPNGVHADGFQYGVYVFVAPATRENATHFNRTDRPVAELDAIFDVVPLNEMKSMTVLDFPSGKGSFVNEMFQLGVNIYGADIFVSRKALRTGRIFPANLLWTPFYSSTFDLILSMNGPLSSKDHRDTFSDNLREVRRILKTNGRLLIGMTTKGSAEQVKKELEGDSELRYVGFTYKDKNRYLGIVEIRKMVKR